MSQRVAFCSRLFPGISDHLQELSATPCNMLATWVRLTKELHIRYSLFGLTPRNVRF